MEFSSKPDIKLATKVLPVPLLKGLKHIYNQNIKNCMLVGGTALNGFYSGQRRSDDLDIFVKDENAFKSVVLACKSLAKIGTQIDEINHSNQYYNAVCKLNNHVFTIDIVVDNNLFRIGNPILINDTIQIADLKTLFITKSSTLVSRCNEKDLYDLLWFFSNIKKLTIKDLVEAGSEIDKGFNPENLLYSIGSAELKKESCDFILDKTISINTVYKRIIKLQKKLLKGISEYLETENPIPLYELITEIKNIK